MDIQLPPEIDIEGNNMRLQIRTVENCLQKYASIKADRLAQLEQYRREVNISNKFIFQSRRSFSFHFFHVVGG